MAARKPVVVGSDGTASELAGNDTLPTAALPPSVLDYVLASRWDGTVPAGQVIAGMPVLRPFAFPAGLAGSMLVAVTPAQAAAAFVLSYVRAGARTTIATFNFAAGATVATIGGVVIPTLAVGDLVDLTGPATADATLATIYTGIMGTKQ